MAQTQHMIRIAIPVVLVLNYYLGAWEETALLFVLTWIYNDLGGGEDGFVIRNTVIATAFSQYNKGSLRVATQGGFTVKPDTWCWLVMTSAVIATTMHVQDMKDQNGDAIKGRRTVPLVLGDSKARWTIAVPTVVWSIACPAFWRLSPVEYILPAGVGLVVAFRILFLRNIRSDKRTWWIWTMWTSIIWMLPLLKNHNVLTEFRPSLST